MGQVEGTERATYNIRKSGPRAGERNPLCLLVALVSQSDLSSVERCHGAPEKLDQATRIEYMSIVSVQHLRYQDGKCCGSCLVLRVWRYSKGGGLFRAQGHGGAGGLSEILRSSSYTGK